jgi:tetratricopeptide (TPR) repeat protein
VTDQLALVRRGGPLRLDDALGIAAALGAAKLVWGEVGAGGAAPGARTARLTLYDVATGTPLHPSTMAYAAGGPSAADLRLTASSLLRGTGESPWKGRSRGHPSLAAWLAYDAGRAAIARWDIADAMRALRTATTIDPSHAPANLWLSLAEMWSGLPADQWRGAVRRAHEQRDQLDPGDTALATAQLALAEDNYPAACAAYQRVIRTDTTGVIGWYGLGECQSRDSLVVRDPAARGGWRFRGDMNRAIHAYLAIVDGRGPPQPAFVYSRLAQLLPTAANHLRRGYSAGQDRLEFGAFAAFDGDTLGFVPFPLGDKGAAGGARFAAASARAIDHSRALLRRLYAPWAATAPATVEAHVTLASYLETLEDIGDSETNPLSALGQIRRAHLLSSDPAEQRALARTELRLLVKNADWSHAARLADSLFAASPHPITDSTLAGAAALTGRISTLAAILRAWGGAPTFSLSLPNGTPLDLSPALAQDAAGTFAFALTGACVEALRGYRQRLDRQLASYVPDPAQRIIVRGVLLRRPLSVGMPCVGAGALAGIDPAGDRMVMLEQAFAAHDTARVRAIYAALMNARALSRPGDTSMDYTFMESWILAAIGDTTEATTHLDRSLEALPTLGVYFLNFPAHAAALVRAMGLRAELAAAAGDQATAARWAGAVATLWANADPELQPYVQRMQALAGRDRSGATGDRER